MSEIQRIIEGLSILEKYESKVLTDIGLIATFGNPASKEDEVKLNELGWDHISDTELKTEKGDSWFIELGNGIA